MSSVWHTCDKRMYGESIKARRRKKAGCVRGVRKLGESKNWRTRDRSSLCKTSGGYHPAILTLCLQYGTFRNCEESCFETQAKKGENFPPRVTQSGTISSHPTSQEQAGRSIFQTSEEVLIPECVSTFFHQLFTNSW